MDSLLREDSEVVVVIKLIWTTYPQWYCSLLSQNICLLGSRNGACLLACLLPTFCFLRPGCVPTDVGAAPMQAPQLRLPPPWTLQSPAICAVGIPAQGGQPAAAAAPRL
eukprot:COSAG05_NODE_1601_length_4438_cov_383.363909_2_plen_109_part_00